MWSFHSLSLFLSASLAELGYPPWDYREGPCAGPVSSLCALIMAPGTNRASSHPWPYVLDCNVHTFLSCMLIEKLIMFPQWRVHYKVSHRTQSQQSVMPALVNIYCFKIGTSLLCVLINLRLAVARIFLPMDESVHTKSGFFRVPTSVSNIGKKDSVML